MGIWGAREGEMGGDGDVGGGDCDVEGSGDWDLGVVETGIWGVEMGIWEAGEGDLGGDGDVGGGDCDVEGSGDWDLEVGIFAYFAKQ